ncbi:hypothetical protein [Pedobacter cryoconitis]|uniref:immunity protein Imm33 domain-containing protein n=1 Tax=Pedobacter cryoconitis TaxID=188932 RepID=UPI00160D3D45|nr:hypothetical protein [Pedobacter cryoconitis]MBB5649187.1 hypothetical protein [Pedobacter cryoconitis]
MDYKKERKIICEKYGSPLIDSPEDLKVGISRNVRDGIWPINGLRHPLEGDTTGWYIWAGEEFSTDPDFFVPLHVKHLNEWCPVVLKYLSLAPGWRFLVTNDYEDVWQDDSLLDI